MPSPSPEFVTRIAVIETGLAARWRRFWEPPEQFLLDAGGRAARRADPRAADEHPPRHPGREHLPRPDERAQHVTGLVITLAAFVLALLVYAMVARDQRQRWLPLATSFFDVTLISLANRSFAFVSDPHVVVNSKVTFDTYFIALGGTALRFDRRVALVTGRMAIAQFMAVVGWVAYTFPLDITTPAGAYGVFRWADQVSRLVLLAAATMLNVYIVRGIQKQRELSNADPLTGVFNRRFFDDYILSEIARASRFQGRMAVAMIDVDWFKQFNDRYGHAAGDRALKNVARAMQLAVRRSDLVARYGGEEFVVLLREADSAQALERVEQIRQAIHSEPHEVGDAGPVSITVSAGVAAWPQDGDTVGDLMATADRRLFQAKDGGRNRAIGPEGIVVHAGRMQGRSRRTRGSGPRLTACRGMLRRSDGAAILRSAPEENGCAARRLPVNLRRCVARAWTP